MARAKYVPHNWNAGELILESNMDHMESGVATADSDAVDAVNAIAPQYSDLTFPISAYTQTCWYNNKLYVNKTNIASSEQWNSSHWEEISVGSKITQLDNHFPATGRFATGDSSATQDYSSAIGSGNTASGIAAFAEGASTNSTGGASHSEGSHTTASGMSAHAEGESTVASGSQSHAEGNRTTASGLYSHAGGYSSVASGRYSHAHGLGIEASTKSQMVFGEYNEIEEATAMTKDYQRGQYAEIVGNGTSANARSNARTLDWSGNETLSGDLTINKNGANQMIVGQELSGLKSVKRNEKTLTGNVFVIDDGDSTASELTVDVTDMKKIGLIVGGSSILENQSVIVCNRNIHTGQSTAEFSADNLTWKLNIQFDGILPPGDYILSYHYKGLLPQHRRILSYTRYEDNQWRMINGSYSPLSNEATDVDELIEDTITLEHPYSVFTYNFLTSRLTDITGTQYVSDIMLRPAGVTENIYTPHEGTVYSVPNNDTENTVSNIIKVGQNIVYCGSGLGHLTYMSEKYATKVEANHIRAVIDETAATAQEDHSTLSAHFPATGKFVVGTNTSATEENAVAEGEDTIASGLSSHAEGYSSEASGDYSHSEGGSVASGGYSHAEGSASEASGDNAHAEGYETTASSDNSHSEGWGTTASGMNAHAEGVDTVASGNQSHAEGEGTIANHAAQSVSGTYNVADTSQAAATAKGTYAEIIGNGTADNARSNARTLDWSGNEELAGDITVNKDTENEIALGQAMADLKNDYTQKIVKDYYTRHFWGDYTGQRSFTVGPLTITRLKNHFTINGTLNASDTSSSHYYIALTKEVAKCNKFNAGNATIDPYLYFEDGASYKISTVNPSGTISTDGQVQLTLELIRQGSNNALCAINSSKLLNSSGGSDWFLALDIWIMSGESVTFNSYKFDIYVSKADNLFSGALTIGDGSDNEMTITAEQMTTLKNTVNALPKILSGYAVSTGTTGDLGHINVSFGEDSFQSTPVVVATAYGANDDAPNTGIVQLTQITTTGFKALTFKTTTSPTGVPVSRANSVRVYWIAIGT